MEAGQTTPNGDGDELVRELADMIFDRMKLSSKSATLKDVVTSGCWYLLFDEAKREIVFDMRALYLGFLSAGLHPQKGNVGNTARWFQAWLAQKVGAEAIATTLAQRTDLTPAGRLLISGFSLLPSISVGDLQELARSYALRTVKRPAFDARHLFAAMIERGKITQMTRRIFKVSLTAGDIDDLKRDLVEHIMRSPEKGETRDAWLQTLRLKTAPVPDSEKGQALPDSPPPDESLPAFNGDTPTALGADVLNTKEDVEALAQLICLGGAAPLAVAIFGDWGSGKSTFMARLEARVKALNDTEVKAEAEIEAAAEPRAPGEEEVTDDDEDADPDEAGAARFVHPIVQIRFNAWHFADANLWASLTAEFFDQLRAGGYYRTGQARLAELVEKVNLHVHALSNVVSANREAVTQGAKDLVAAQDARDKAARKARVAAQDQSLKALGQATMDVLSLTFSEQKGLLNRLGLNRDRAASPTASPTTSSAPPEPQAAKGAEVIVEVVQDLASTFGKLKAIKRVLLKTPARTVIAAGLLMLILAGVGAGIAVLRGWWAVDPAVMWAAAVPLLASAWGLAQAVGPVVKLVNGVAERGAAIAAEVDKASKESVSLLLTQEARLKKALAEAKALEEAELASAKALSRYIDPAGASNPPRLLRYVLEDDPDTKALEKDIGLIGRTRRLFQAVDDIARKVGKARAKARKKGLPNLDKYTPERIVIYIDDLDRCSETKVYEVLQAVHLLLAFDLFVVVVGVDVGWVRAALAKQFEDSQDLADEQARSERAIAYLEKIFQVPFWLRPLSQGEGGTFSGYVKALAGTSAEDDAKARADKAAEEAAEAARRAEAAKAAAEADLAPDAPVAEHSAPPPRPEPPPASPPAIVEARRALQLNQVEIDFLASPEIAAVAAAAPRGVKRLVNIYRLARTRRGQEDAAAVLGGAGKPPEYPLIALMAAVETGQKHSVAEGFYDLLKNGEKFLIVNLLTASQDPDLAPASSAPDESLKAAADVLIKACEAAAKVRKTPLTADDLLAAARLVRRYSFNRYR